MLMLNVDCGGEVKENEKPIKCDARCVVVGLLLLMMSGLFPFPASALSQNSEGDRLARKEYLLRSE